MTQVNQAKLGTSKEIVSKSLMINLIRIITFLIMGAVILTFYQNWVALTDELALWIIVILFLVNILLEVWQDYLLKGEIATSYSIMVWIFILANIVAILGFYFDFLAGYSLTLVFGTFILQLIVRFLSPSDDFKQTMQDGSHKHKKQSKDWTEYESLGTKIKNTFNRQRFSTTFLFMAFGIVIMSTANLAEVDWLIGYLIPILFILPFVIVLIREVIVVDFRQKNIKEWFKETGLLTAIIEGAILVISFIFFMWIMWDYMLPQGFKDFWEFKSWTIVSWGFSIAITLMTHAFWGLNRIRKMSGGGLWGNVSLGPARVEPTKRLFNYAKDCGYNGHSSRPIYFLCQFLLIGILIVDFCMMGRIVQNILETEILDFSNGISLVICIIVMFGVIEGMEKEYFKFNYFSTSEYRKKNMSRPYALEGIAGFIVFGFVVIFILAGGWLLMSLMIADLIIIGFGIVGFIFIISPNFSLSEEKLESLIEGTDGKTIRSRSKHSQLKVKRVIQSKGEKRYIFE